MDKYQRDQNKFTRNGKPRKGKATITERRLFLRTLTWKLLQQELQAYLKNAPKGAAARMARTIGIQPSQIHRYTCPVCEHEQEPVFSIGVALALYLARERIELNLAQQQFATLQKRKKN